MPPLRPTIILSTILLLAACATRPGAPRAPDAAREAADRAAIEALHRADMRAVLAGDTAYLKSILTDDVVSITPDGVREGRAANEAYMRAAAEASRGMVPVEYVLDFREVVLLGDHAYEWGTVRGRVRPAAGGPDVAYAGKVSRLLRRQSDGSWKVARTMFAADAP